MDVFGAALGESGQFLRGAAISAAHELGVFGVSGTLDEIADALGMGPGRRRLRALLDVLVALGVMSREGERFNAASVPGRVDVPREGWGLLADVIREDKPLSLERGEHERRMHQHLADAGAAVAAELAASLHRELDAAGARAAAPTSFAQFSPEDTDSGARASASGSFASFKPEDTDSGAHPEIAVGRVRTGEHDIAVGRVGTHPEIAIGRVGTDSHVEIARARVSTARMRRLSTQPPADRVDTGMPRSLLDLGGGAGAYTAAFLDANADARATLVDYPEVIALARDHLARFGDRVSFVEGDARSLDLSTLPRFGVVVLANVLHLHGPLECAQLCAVAARAVAPGGSVVIKDLRVDDDRRGPIEGLLFALNMAVYTGGGDVYSAAQIGAWLRDAGVEHVAEQRFEVAADAFAIVGRRPAVPDEVEIDRVRKKVASRLSRVGKIAWRELAAEGRLRDGAQPRHLTFPDAFERRLATALLDGVNDEAIMQHYLETLPRMRVAQIVSTDEPGVTFMHTPLVWDELPRMSDAIDRLYAVLREAEVEPTAALGAASADDFRAASRTFAEMFMPMHYGACMPLLYGYPADLAYFDARGRELGLGIMGTIDRYLTAPVVHELCHFGRTRETLPTHLDECIGGWLGVHVWPEFAYPLEGRDDAIPHAPLLAQVGQAFARVFGVRALVRAQTGAVPWREALPPRVVDAAQALCAEDWRARRTLHFLSDTSQPRPWVALALAGGAGHNLSVHTVRSLAQLDISQLALPGNAQLDRVIVEDAVRAMCLVTEVVGGSLRTRSVVPAEPIRVDAASCTMRCGDKSYWIPPGVGRTMELRLARLDDISAAVDSITGVTS